MMIQRFLLLLFFSFFSLSQAFPYESLSDSARISLVTYSANDEVHAMYGHTALRVFDPLKGIDVAFNYGTFDFKSSNFLYRFVKGETDYMLSAGSFEESGYDSAMRNLSMTEQTLNLTTQERERLWALLLENLQPSNRVYRYSFLFDNCATRPFLMIKKCLKDEKLVLIDKDPATTFRQKLHECTSPFPWVTFGIDLVLGGRIDQPMTYREQLFLPHYLMLALANATVVSGDGQSRPLISKEELILEKEPDEIPETLFTPLAGGVLIVVVTLLFCYLGIKQRRLYRGFDVALFTPYGLAGMVVFFLITVSEHPAVSPNINGIWLHPLHFVFAVMMVIPFFCKFARFYHLLNVVMISLYYAVRLFSQQVVNPALDIYIFPLWIRSVTQLMILAKHKK